ncbi:hypothetical protein DFJ58DRAFT_861886 [Suillus subalutaceus]|uniref:uncharacterized protein n=1 Tax=Suillus subalutaceus TaxID=48586 RepID=UPI001B872F78|nr:uncharacterized protein DFJ58DRAFT_861886 [Suillus subalutaceus]KAG1838153.1 hypothetical protein DFJ58DRAFT_861886 [Suillus subalutaceus]
MQILDKIKLANNLSFSGHLPDDLRGPLGHVLSQLNKSVNHINSEAASKTEQRFWQRFFSVTIDRDQIAQWEKDLDRIIALFNFEAIVRIATGVEKLVSGLNTTSVHVLKYHPTEPPSRPAMLYGHDGLVAELTNLVVNDEHLALIGLGGMGKSSVAKAIINEPLVMEKFADRRFFATYDDLDPSTITFRTFMTRFARALGIEIAGSDPVRQISTFLRSASALVVLDNAETFEEASALSVPGYILQAIAEMANIPGVVLVLTSRSRRNALNVQWITKDIPPLDLSSAQAAFFQIYHHASRSEAKEDIKGLLGELDFHPLSINILANAVQQNGWSPTKLLKRWNDRHSKVLDGGKGKLQSLSDTMQLSLSLPSVQHLGEDGLRVLAIIAFLPQGLNEDLASDLLPSLPQVDAICDVLCMQSLVYRQDKFFKMLAPIRHYVQDSLQAPDSTCLQEIRAFYYRTVYSCLEEHNQYADTIISDHLNIEHVVAFNLANIPNDAEETYNTCWQFLECLERHLPRPTTLNPAISNIIENSSTWALKALCLSYLAQLYQTLSQNAEAILAFQTAEALYLTAGDPKGMGNCLITRADLLGCQGCFIQSRNLLDDLQHSDSWESLRETTKARAWYFLDIARMYTFTAPAGELFVKSSEDRIWDLSIKIWHCLAKFYHGGDAVQVHAQLEDLSVQHAGSGNVRALEDIHQGLAEVASSEGRLYEAMDILQKIVVMDGQSAEGALWSTMWKAHAVSKQGDYDLARELIRTASGPFQFFALRSARTFIHKSYGSACIELTAGEWDRAESYFTATIEACDMQSNLMLKALSIRGSGGDCICA